MKANRYIFFGVLALLACAIHLSASEFVLLLALAGMGVLIQQQRAQPQRCRIVVPPARRRKRSAQRRA